MSKNQHQAPKRLTFGNIMVALLVLGTFVVIGLLGKLYLELTKTPENTAANYERQQQQQARVEMMTPDPKAGAQPVYRDANASAPAPQQANVQAAPSLPENEMAMASEPSKINTAALSSGTPKKAAPRKANTQSADAAQSGAGSLQGEVQLQPTNAPAPRGNTNVAGERKLTPVANGNNDRNVGERALTPQPAPARNSPRKGNDDAIDALF